jgi:hypothetical protein
MSLHPKEVALMIRRLRAVLVIGLMTVPFALATAADAQSCPPADPTCAVDQVAGTDQHAADDPVGSVHDGADAAAATGQDAVDDAARDTVGIVGETVDQLLSSGEKPPSGGGNGGTSGGKSHGSSGSSDSGHHSHRDAGAARSADGAARVPAKRSGPLLGAESAMNDESLVPIANHSSDPNDHAALPTVAAVAVGVIGGVTLMAVLLGAVVAFLGFQDRIDRRDPKLALAAVGSDRVSFG